MNVVTDLNLIIQAAATLTSEQLANVIQQLPIAVAIVEAPSGKTVLNNKLSTEIFRQRGGRARDGVDGYGEYTGFRPDGTRLGARDWPLARSILTGEIVRGEEIEIVRGDGSHAVVRISSGPVVDPHGKITAGVVVYDDITESRRGNDIIRFIAEASQLLASSLDYQTTLQAIAKIAVPKLADWCSIDLLSTDGQLGQVAVAHVDPKKVELAREWRQKYPPDMTAKTGLPRVVREGTPEIYPEITDAMIVQALQQDPERLRITRELGLLSAITVPLLVAGKAIGALSLISSNESGRRFDGRDLDMANEIAARAALAVENARLYGEAKRAVHLRDDFLAVASHELRTPLHTLRLQLSGMERALERDPSTPLAPAKLERLQSQVDRLAALVDTLLDVSRLDGGALALSPVQMDLGSAAQDVVARLAEETTRTGTEVTVDIEGEVHGRWDRERVDQIITNLLMNALKYAAGKPVRVVVKGSGDHEVSLAVVDSGPGISPEDRHRIFQRFERATSSKNVAGLGLGLWIVQQAAVAHGGRASVSCEQHEGAAFVVVLPRG